MTETRNIFVNSVKWQALKNKAYCKFFVDVLEDELFRRWPVDVDGDEAGFGTALDQLIAFHDEFLEFCFNNYVFAMLFWTFDNF